MAATLAAAAGAADGAETAVFLRDMVESPLTNTSFYSQKYYKVLVLKPLRTSSNACEQLFFGEMAPPYIPELCPQLNCTA